MLLLLAACASAEAEPPIPEARMARFEALDLDRDGFISQAEAARHADVERDFAQSDADGDGRLDPQEFNILEAQLAKDRRPGMTGSTYHAPSQAR